MLSLELNSSYFLKYLQLIAVTRKTALKNFARFPGKQLCWSLLLIKLQPLSFNSNRLQHRCFLVNITKFLRASILKISANGCFFAFICHRFLNSYRIIASYSFRYYMTYFAKKDLIIKFKVVHSYIKYTSVYMYQAYWK